MCAVHTLLHHYVTEQKGRISPLYGYDSGRIGSFAWVVTCGDRGWSSPARHAMMALRSSGSPAFVVLTTVVPAREDGNALERTSPTYFPGSRRLEFRKGPCPKLGGSPDENEKGPRPDWSGSLMGPPVGKVNRVPFALTITDVVNKRARPLTLTDMVNGPSYRLPVPFNFLVPRRPLARDHFRYCEVASTWSSCFPFGKATSSFS